MTDAIRDQETVSADSDELRAFVAGTLRSINAGILDVRDETAIENEKRTGLYKYNPPEEVVFDIAVTATRTGSVGGGLKLQVFSVGANADKRAGTEDSTVSRIQFKVPTKFWLHRS